MWIGVPVASNTGSSIQPKSTAGGPDHAADLVVPYIELRGRRDNVGRQRGPFRYRRRVDAGVLDLLVKDRKKVIQTAVAGAQLGVHVVGEVQAAVFDALQMTQQRQPRAADWRRSTS